MAQGHEELGWMRLMKMKDPQSGSARHPLESAASEGMVWRWMPYSPGGPPLHSPGEFSVPVDQGEVDAILEAAENGRAVPVFTQTPKVASAVSSATFLKMKDQGNSLFKAGEFMKAVSAYNAALNEDGVPPADAAVAHSNAAQERTDLSQHMEEGAGHIPQQKLAQLAGEISTDRPQGGTVPWEIGGSTPLGERPERTSPREWKPDHPAHKKPKLGKTSGILAVGAWSARLEIAGMLQEGIPAEDILRVIQSGEESDQPLLQQAVPLGGDLEPPLDKRARATGPDGAFASNKMRRETRSPSPRSFSVGGRSGTNRAEPVGKGNSFPSPDGAPSWAAAPSTGIKFGRKAVDPNDLVPSPTTPLDSGDDEPTGEDEHLGSQEGSDKIKIFEELVILSVDMDLIDFVTHSNESTIDEEKFRAITEPRSPGTGLRYARLLWNYVDKAESTSTSEVGRPALFGIEMIQREIMDMISKEMGFMTPLSFIYAVEHFSAVFGFASPGSKHPRCRKLALDYSKKAPEKRQAPPFSVQLLDYLERSVLDESKEISHRLVLGKLRLCTQASVRHSDLATTALSRVEWCRVVGEKTILGLRARAGKTKSGPRPWAASWLGVRPENDKWLFVFAQILLDVHGGSWSSHGFLGCASDGKGSFAAAPPCIGEDVTLAKQAMMADLEAGRSVPLSESEVKSLRWHSCKTTLTTLMVHMGIKSRSIRYQGAWRKASESMIDLYLREAQVLVIKAQMEVLDQVRRGVTLCVLEGRPLDLVPGASCWSNPDEMFKQGVPAGVRPDEAVRAMDAAVVCVADADGGEVKIRGEHTPDPADLPEAFKDVSLLSASRLEKKVQEERTLQAECMSDLVQEVESELLEGDSGPDLDSDESDVEPEAADMSLLPFFICSSKGTGKVHRPGESILGTVAGHRPACGVQGKNFVALTLSENWGTYSLCERCFGKPDGCGHLCDYEVYKDGEEAVRCSRRCAPGAVVGHPGEGAEMPEGFSHRCALHAAVVDE
eukprot:s164_g45.t1